MSFQRLLISSTVPLRYGLDNLLYRLNYDQRILKELRNAYSNRPLLVVGNGPSLNRTPLAKFAKLPSIGMNKIDLIFGNTEWRPSFIVCLNNAVARQHQDAFAASDIPVFLAWKSRWLLRSKNRKAVNYYPVTASNSFSYNPLQGFGSSATVTYIALQLAHWMGADPVILFGVDHSFKFEGRAGTYQKRKGPDVNHFHADYFSAGSVWGTPDLQRSEREYQLAKDAFEKHGRKILDATIGGRLDIFPKISVEDALRYADTA